MQNFNYLHRHDLQKGKRNFDYLGVLRLPYVKGAVGASRLRDCLSQPSNRCAISEPVSATPASVLRTLANPLCKGSSAAGGEGLFFTTLPPLRGPPPLTQGRHKTLHVLPDN